MGLLAQLIINGIIAGSIYGLVSAGFSIIYSTNKFMHFAHGASIVFAGYMLYVFSSMLHVPLIFAALLSVILTGGFGFMMYWGIYSPLEKRKSSHVVLLVASVGLLVLTENVFLLLFGPEVKSATFAAARDSHAIFGALVTKMQVVLIVSSIIFFVVLWYLVYRTKFGVQLRAVSDHKELSQVFGVDSFRISSMSFIIGSLFAGVAGVLICLEQSVSPSVGTMLMVKGFTGAVIGGLGSVPGAVIGSYVVGLAENVGLWWLPSSWKDGISFGLLFIFLLVKPQGLFGKRLEGKND